MIDNAIIAAFGICFALLVVAAFLGNLFHKSVESIVFFQTVVFFVCVLFLDLIVEFVRFLGMA